MKSLVLIVAALAAGTALADVGPSLPRLFARPQAAPAKPQPKESPKAEAEPQQVAATQPAIPGGAEVDTAEIVRRGDRVTRAGSGPMSSEEQALSEATAPPADDSGKWFVSLIVDDSMESQALLYDLRHSPHLRAWIDLDEPKGSWSHATVYRKGDQTQDWRWKNLRISTYPVMILQPPAKLRDETKPDSWIWGDPKTVVWQFDGYDARSATRAQDRANAIRKALTLYVAKIAERQQVVNIGPRARVVPPPTPGPRGDAPTPGARQGDISASPPFALPPSIQTPGGNPVFPADPMVPSIAPAIEGSLVGLAGALFAKVFGSPITPLWLLVGLRVAQMAVALTPNKKDDAIVAAVSSVVDRITKTQPSQNASGQS